MGGSQIDYSTDNNTLREKWGLNLITDTVCNKQKILVTNHAPLNLISLNKHSLCLHDTQENKITALVS